MAGGEMRGGAAAIGLLLALLVVGVLMVKGALAPSPSQAAMTAPGASPADRAASGTTQDRATRLKNEARDGVTKAMDDAEARRQEADKP